MEKIQSYLQLFFRFEEQTLHMNDVFKKLNYKDQKVIYVINAPESFNKALNEMKDLASIKTNPPKSGEIEFVLSFVTKQKEVDTLTKQITSSMASDGVLWFAYPKGTSKKYTCEFNRDNGWKELGATGYEPVRMVAIDEDWSALRFRNVDHIKKMIRSRTISEKGKEKITAAKGIAKSKKK